MSKNLKIEKTTNLDCFRDFSHGAVIKTDSGRSLGATCDPKEAESIIRNYFMNELFPEPVHVYFGGEIGQCGTWGYTFSLTRKLAPSKRKEFIKHDKD